MKSKRLLFLIIHLILICILNSCVPVHYLRGINPVYESSNRKTIQTIKIGDQTWLTKNLDVDHYRNGDTIPQIQDDKEWRKLKTGAWCYYFNYSEIDPVFGKLYNWYAVNDPRGLAPEGWRVPTNKEWKSLIMGLGSAKLAAKKMKDTGTMYWPLPNEGATNESGFTALPNGLRAHNGHFYDFGSRAVFWSESSVYGSKAWGANIDCLFGIVRRKPYWKKEGLGVRLICLGDSCKPVSNKVIASLIHNDSTKTETVKIGTQIWMIKNLEVDHYRNGDSIPQVQNSKEWEKLTTGAWCFAIFRTQYGINVNKLYNWYAVNDPRGLAPEGWHIPTDAEWTTLTDFLGGEKVAGGKMKEKGKTHWRGTNKRVTNENGFTAIPYGRRNRQGKFSSAITLAAYWTASPYSKSRAYSFDIEQFADYIGINKEYTKNNGLSVRCIALQNAFYRPDTVRFVSKDSQDKMLKEFQEPVHPFFNFGFELGINTDFLIIKPIENLSSHIFDSTFLPYDIAPRPDSARILSIGNVPKFGFFVGISATLLISRFFELRFAPSLAYANSKIIYNLQIYEHGNASQYQITKNILSTYLHFPLELKNKFIRSKKIQAYLVAGAQYTLDLASQAKKREAKSSTEKIVKFNQNNLFINTGLGISFNRGGFRFSLELKNSYGVFDVLKKEDNIYTDGIQSIKSNIVHLSIVFD